jgi:hypothetical protein
MYSVDEKDKVVELKDAPQSSVGAPLPLVLSDERTLLLAYLIQDAPYDWVAHRSESLTMQILMNLWRSSSSADTTPIASGLLMMKRFMDILSLTEDCSHTEFSKSKTRLGYAN